MKIGLTYDLRTDYLKEGFTTEQVAEFDSEETIAAIESGIRSLGHQTDRIGHGKALARRLVAGDRWDLVFNIAEGLTGRSRESQVPAMLELYGVPYCLSDPLVCAATLDKGVAKRLVQSAGLATSNFAVITGANDLDNLLQAEAVSIASEAGLPTRLVPGATSVRSEDPPPVRESLRLKLKYPLFVKPLAEGTGKGVDGHSFIDSPDKLRQSCLKLLERFQQPVLVEEFLPGREFTTAILGTGPKARVLGTMEVEVLQGAGNIYSYESKELCERLCRYSHLTQQPLKARVEELALACYRALECRDTARVDVRLDAAGNPNFMEVNPLPGMHPTHSDLPMIATMEGMSYPKLLDAIIASALERVGQNHA